MTTARVRLGCIIGVTVLMAGLTGCSQSGRGPEASGSDSTASASSSPTQPPYDTNFQVADPYLSADAVRAFGASGARRGARAAVAFSEKAFYDDECVSTKAGDNADQCAYSLGEYMTPDTQAEWDKNVDAFIADAKAEDFGASDGAQAVLAVSFYGAMTTSYKQDGHVFTPVKDGPVMVNKDISKVTTGVDSAGRLTVTMESTADMRLQRDHKPTLWHLGRTVTYYMVQSDGQWKIEAVDGKWTSNGMSDDKNANHA